MKLNKNSKSLKLLCLTAKLVMNVSLQSTKLNLFHGLKQSNKYREELLHGLWNYQILNSQSEQDFNHWLSTRISPCAICYLFNSNNKYNSHLFLSIRHLLNFDQLNTKSHYQLVQCEDCFVTVHEDCYENLCLALNIQIKETNQSWLCQRCILQRESSMKILDDRCSACLFRGGLLLNPPLSSTFIHGICSIYQTYEPSSSITNNPKFCHYCWSFSPLNFRQITTQIFVSCNYSNCSNLFHVTCGLINGCTFDIDHDYSIINARCHLHTIPHQSSLNNFTHQSTIDNIDYEIMEGLDQQQQQQYEEDEDEIVAENERLPIGTRVIFHETKEKKIGRVIGNEISFHYVVDFGDGCYSHDMYGIIRLINIFFSFFLRLAEDILDFNPSIEPLMLNKGSDIRIKWTDDRIYSCKYIGRKRVLLYNIKFDNETRQMRRREFLVDNQTPSLPLTSCQTEHEHNYSRRQPLTSSTKRQHQRKQPNKRKRRRIISSSSDEIPK